LFIIRNGMLVEYIACMGYGIWRPLSPSNARLLSMHMCYEISIVEATANVGPENGEHDPAHAGFGRAKALLQPLSESGSVVVSSDSN